MRQDIAEKWIEALESGRYQQTQGTLYDGQGYCCLGVLCDLVGRKFELVKRYNEYAIVESGERFSLPEDVVAETEMKSQDGNFLVKVEIEDEIDGIKEENEIMSLAELNDDGKTFGEIAEVIKERWTEL